MNGGTNGSVTDVFNSMDADHRKAFLSLLGLAAEYYHYQQSKMEVEKFLDEHNIVFTKKQKDLYERFSKDLLDGKNVEELMGEGD